MLTCRPDNIMYPARKRLEIDTVTCINREGHPAGAYPKSGSSVSNNISKKWIQIPYPIQTFNTYSRRVWKANRIKTILEMHVHIEVVQIVEIKHKR